MTSRVIVVYADDEDKQIEKLIVTDNNGKVEETLMRVKDVYLKFKG
ncbi:MAG TPA: hypothetical protein VI914_07465 [Thermodesulfobacteriota bacterium]|nr:hypothetical protein [Thermodesulfobacteriota bacterium]